jgi:predicted hydrocarbon binding protein
MDMLKKQKYVEHMCIVKMKKSWENRRTKIQKIHVMMLMLMKMVTRTKTLMVMMMIGHEHGAAFIQVTNESSAFFGILSFCVDFLSIFVNAFVIMKDFNEKKFLF